MADRAKFRQLVEAKEIVVLPGAYDALSAKLAQAAGFEAAYMTGYGQSASKLAQPDVGLMTLSEMAERVRDICAAVSIPVICDGDTGFGNAVNLIRTIHEYENAGAAGIQLEDQTLPKKCGHMLGRQLVSAEEMVMKLEAAKAARRDPDFLIVARTDARTTYGIEEAIRRAKLYEQAGADIIFVESVESVEEMKAVNAAITKPTIANMVNGGRTPYLAAGELQELGYRLVVFPIATLLAASRAVIDALAELRATGIVTADNGKRLDFEQFNELIGLPGIRKIEANDFSGVENWKARV